MLNKMLHVHVLHMYSTCNVCTHASCNAIRTVHNQTDKEPDQQRGREGEEEESEKEEEKGGETEKKQ